VEVIWKYPLQPIPLQTVQMPSGARFLHADVQSGRQLAAWFVVDPGAEAVDRLVYMVGTGRPLPEPADRHTFLTTVQSGQFVWHFFIEDEVGR